MDRRRLRNYRGNPGHLDGDSANVRAGLDHAAAQQTGFAIDAPDGEVPGSLRVCLLNVTFLIVGLWLIAGLRLGIWNQGMLGCIPIFLFMFLIYYAVSALTGLIWKSAVISVVLTVLFYIVCWLVDTTHELAGAFIIDQHRISKIAQADDALITVTEAGQVQLWDNEAGTWRAVSAPAPGPRNSHDRRSVLSPAEQATFAGTRLSQSVRHQGPARLAAARRREQWLAASRWTRGSPSGTAAFLVTHDDSILAIASDNIFRFRGDLTTKASSIKFLGMKLPLMGGGEFRPCLSGDRPDFPDPVAAAADPKEPRIVVCAGNLIHLLAQQQDGALLPIAQRSLGSKEKEGSAIAIAGDLVVVGREDGKVLVLSAADLSIRQELFLESNSQPRFVAALRDGSRFAVLFQNRNLWFIDGHTGAATQAPLPSQGQISGFAWTPNRLLVADYANRVVAYDLEKLARQEVYRSPPTRFELAYYYIVDPLHTVFPKPRLLNNTVRYMLTGKRTTDGGLFQGDLSQQREDLHPWSRSEAASHSSA